MHNPRGGTAKIPYDPLDIDIDHIYLEQTFWKQDGKCAIGSTIDPQNIFIGRAWMVNSKGYVKGNVVDELWKIVRSLTTGRRQHERIRLQFGL